MPAHNTATTTPNGLLPRPLDLSGARRGGHPPRGPHGCHQEVRPTPRLRARAALLATGTRTAVASHHTAARLHGLVLPSTEGPEHVTVPRTYRYLRRHDLRSHTRTLPDHHVTRVNGLPCTTVPRTVLDLARELPRLPAIWLIEDALHRRLVTRPDLETCLAELPRSPGDRDLRAHLAAATGTTGTFLQCAARIALADADLPPFTPSYDLVADGVTLCTADGAYPEHRLALEFQDPARAPHWRWLPLGWRLRTFTWRDLVHEPARFTTAVSEHLSARQEPD
ncbi:hypothetical protein [Crossiella sp. NPDC003009]